ncbi:hypothetical protein ACUXV3_05855 [Roseobacteraceae bacterium NS-SX3]
MSARAGPRGGAAGLQAWAGAVPLVLRYEPGWRLGRTLLRFLGAVLVLSSSGLWLMPGAPVDLQMGLIKGAVSVAFLFFGVLLMTVHDPGNGPEACFDPVRRELRILQPDARGLPRTVLRRSYASLGGARLTADTVQLFEPGGRLLVEAPVASAAIRSLLRSQLSGEVPILS